MATTTMYAATGAAARPRLMSRAFVLVLLAGVGSSTSFYLLFSALPRYTDAIGAGGVGAGLTTGVMMLATVAAEFAVPRLTARFGYRAVFGTGLVLLGAPALVLAAAGSMPMVLAACLVRGAGFAVAVVLGGALVASIVPAERRGEGLGVHGVACGTPAVASRQLGPGLVIAASGIALLVAVSNPVAVTLGATGFGLLAVRTGYPAAFGLTAALMLLPLLAGTGARTRRTCTA